MRECLCMWICECILRVFFTEVDFIWGALEFRIGFHFIRMLRMNVCTRNLFFIWPFYFFCHLLDRRMFVLMRALFCDARTNFWLLHNDMCCFILFKFEVYCSGRWRKICSSISNAVTDIWITFLKMQFFTSIQCIANDPIVLISFDEFFDNFQLQ